jgi:hypothetical protein
VLLDGSLEGRGERRIRGKTAGGGAVDAGRGWKPEVGDGTDTRAPLVSGWGREGWWCGLCWAMKMLGRGEKREVGGLLGFEG